MGFQFTSTLLWGIILVLLVVNLYQWYASQQNTVSDNLSHYYNFKKDVMDDMNKHWKIKALSDPDIVRKGYRRWY